MQKPDTVLLLLLHNPLIIGIVLIGMVVSSVGSHAAFLPAYVLFSAPITVLLLSRFMVEDGLILFVALMILFILANSSFTIGLSRLIRSNITRGFEREELLVSVQQKRQAAEKANRDKSRFMASVSHDLRQPLHALELFLGSLKPMLKLDAQQQLLDLAQHSEQELGDMLNELMDIARFDAGKIRAERTILSLASLLEDCVTEMRPQAEEQGLSLRARLPRNKYVNSDPVLLKRILRNLLSNAIRYTKTGEILLGTQRHGDTVRIEVHDSGPGIAADKCQHIFDEFYQIHNPERDRDKGLGLGLSIVQRAAKLLDSRVEVRSRLGRGSCFSLTLPLSEAGEQSDPDLPIQQDVDQEVAGMFVLTVDDDRSILRGMYGLLRGWGCEVLQAESKDALLHMLEADAYPPPDVLIVDYRLRDQHTGLEVVESVRQHFNADIPAIIVSGDVHPEVENVVMRSGCHWLKKPVPTGVLRKTLAEIRSGIQT